MGNQGIPFKSSFTIVVCTQSNPSKWLLILEPRCHQINIANFINGIIGCEIISDFLFYWDTVKLFFTRKILIKNSVAKYLYNSSFALIWGVWTIIWYGEAGWGTLEAPLMKGPKWWKDPSWYAINIKNDVNLMFLTLIHMLEYILIGANPHDIVILEVGVSSICVDGLEWW